MRRTTAAAALLAPVLALILALGLAWALPAYAEDAKPTGQERGVSVGLRPATEKGGDASRTQFEYEVPPKGRVVDYVAVSNLRNEPVKVRLFAKDATTTTDSAYAVQASEDAPVDIGSWMSLKKDTITLPPRSETVVPFQLGVPFNATPGDHTGAIVVSLLAKEAKPEGGTVVVDHRIGLRILLRVPGDYRADLEIADLSTSWTSPGTLLGRGDATVSYTVRNTGNLRVSATGAITLDRALGLPAVTANTAAITEIQPGGEIKVRQVIPNVFGTGPLKAEVRLTPRPVDPDLKDITVTDAVAKTSFHAWPLLLIAAVAGLLLLLVIGSRYERRRRRARRAAMAPTGGSHRAPVAADAPSSSKHALVRRAAFGVALGFLGLALAPSPATADDTPGDIPAWQAVSNLKQGTDNTPFDVITTGGCPLPATNVVGFAFGSGFPKEGGVVIGNGDAGVSAEGPFAMPLSSSMQQLVAMQPDPKPLSGTYKIELRCVTPGLEQTTGRYVFAIKFLDAKRWKAMPPLTSSKGPNLTGSDKPRASTDPQDGGQAAPGSAAPGTTGATEEEQRAAAARAAELAGIQEGDTGSEGGVSWPLVGGGLAVLLGTGLYLFRRNNA